MRPSSMWLARATTEASWRLRTSARNRARFATRWSASATSRRWRCCRRSRTPGAIRGWRPWSATTRPSGGDCRRNTGSNTPIGYEEYDDCLEQVDAGRYRAAELAARPVHHPRRQRRRARAVRETDGGHRRRVPADDRRPAASGVKLMIAYRLHFEEINLKAIDLVRRGRIGEPKFFNSSFAMTVRRGDIRTSGRWAAGRCTTSASTASTPPAICSAPSRRR